MDIKGALKKIGKAVNPFDDLADFLEKWLEIAKREVLIFVLENVQEVTNDGIDAKKAKLRREIDQLKGK